jgi:hypothetical protein
MGTAACREGKDGWASSGKRRGVAYTLLLYKINSEELAMAFHDAANNEFKLEFDLVGFVACNYLLSDLVCRDHNMLFHYAYR